MNQMHTVTMTVTPAMAEAWLKDNPNNRKISRTVVGNYARAMAEGRWKLTPEGLAFSTEGNLLNGQHRLLACIASNTSFQSNISFNVDPSVFPYLDRGKTRSPGDILSIAGYVNTNQLSAAAGLLYAYEKGHIPLHNLSHSSISGTPDERLELVQENPELVESINISGNGLLKFSRTSMALINFLGSKIDASKTAEFLEQISTGSGLKDGSPILLLRDKILSSSQAGFAGRRQLQNLTPYRFALAVKAFNFHLRGESLKRLEFSFDRENVPGLIGCKLFGSKATQSI